MGLISHKQIKAFRSYILSPRLELVLLLIYLVSFAMIVNLKISSQNGQSMGNQINISGFDYQNLLVKQMLKGDFDNIKTSDQLYDWIQKVQTERLWIEGGITTANWPIGATRLVQQRVRRKKYCGQYGRDKPRDEDDGDSALAEGEPEACYKYFGTTAEQGDDKLFNCLKSIYSRECNYMYSAGTMLDNRIEDESYVKFEPKTMQCMALADYSKFVFQKADANMDGKLSASELSSIKDLKKSDILPNLHSDLKDDNNEHVFDIDKDKMISKEEFDQFLANEVVNTSSVSGVVCEKDGSFVESLYKPKDESQQVPKPQIIYIKECIDPETCSEYKFAQDTEIGQHFGQFAIYEPSGFFVDFDSNNKKTHHIIKQLRKQNWIDQDTRAIQLTFTIKSLQSLTFFNVRAVIESPNGPTFNNTLQSSFKIQNLALHEKNLQKLMHEDDGSTDTQDIIIHVLILLHFLIYTIKILFELSLGISRITNFLELGNLGAMFFIVVLRLIDFVLQNNLKTEGHIDSTKFVSFQQYIMINKMYSYCLAICSFFYPFRIYQYLAHYPFFNPCVIVMNTFSRTAPGIFVYFFLVTILVLSFAMGVHVILGNQFFEFSTYELTIFSIISSDIQLVKVYNDLRLGYQHEDFDLKIFQLLFVIFRLFVLILGCALMTNLYKKAMAFEKGHATMDPEKKGFYDQVEEISTQINELYKDMTDQSQHHSDRFENQKIVAWLLNRSKESQSGERQQFFENLNQELRSEHLFYGGSGVAAGAGVHIDTQEMEDKDTVDIEGVQLIERDETELAQLNVNKQGTVLKQQKKMEKEPQINKIIPQSEDDCMSITPIEFETPYWLVEFLQSLFQLKPDLKTSVTYRKFRIVIEFFCGSRGESRFDICAIEYVIDHLRYVGCKVPVLIYSDINISNDKYQKIMQLKKNYLMLFFTNDIREVRKFCKMDHMRDYTGQKSEK